MRSMSWGACAALALVTVGTSWSCESADDGSSASLDVVNGREAAALNTGGDNGAAAMTADGSTTGAVSPIENFKQKVVIDAMRGLRYDTGRVVVDYGAGRSVEGVGDVQRAMALFAQAETLLHEQNMVLPALSTYTEAVMIAPNQSVLLNGLGVALLAKGKKAEAEAAFLTALDLDPGFVDARYNLGVLYNNFGEYDAATRSWSEVLRLDPNHAGAHERLASLNYLNGNLDAARMHARAAKQRGASLAAPLERLIESSGENGGAAGR